MHDGNWRWHHQQLALLDAYPEQAQAIISGWRADDPGFSWGDHTTPLRLVRLVMTLGQRFDDFTPGFREFLADLIAEHARRLLTDVARSRHNHALDQVYALALAKRYLPFLPISGDELARRLAIERAHLLSAEGVVTENSPGYQSWIPARIADCRQLLSGEAETDMLHAAQEFTNWIARPDCTWPEFGDTAPGKPVTPTPSTPCGFRAFPHAGYAVLRDDRLYFAAKCGFLSHAHRHADDGSFLLAVAGRDHFVEAGMFGYAKGWEREYARSPAAHNISYRAGANVIRSTTSRRYQRHHRRWGMTVRSNGITCRSFMFDDAVYTRHIDFEPGRICLRDAFDTPGVIRTRFHVPAGVRIEVAPRGVIVGDLVLQHELPDPRVVPGHRTIGYMAYGPAQVIEFHWPPGVLATRFDIRFE